MNFFIILLLFCTGFARFQDPNKIDSLYLKYQSSNQKDYNSDAFSNANLNQLFELLNKPDIQFKSAVLNRIGYIYIVKNPDSAYFFVQNSIQLAKESGNTYSEANSYFILSELREYIGDLDGAIQYNLMSKALSDSLGNIYLSARNEYELGIRYLTQKRFYNAYILLKESSSNYKILNDKYWAAKTNVVFGDLFFETNKLDRAKEYYWLAINQFDSLDNKYEKVVVHWKMFEIENKRGNFDLAKNILNYALKLSEELNSKFEIATTYKSISQLYYNKNDIDSARYYIERSIQYYDDIKIVNISAGHYYANILSEFGLTNKAEAYHLNAFKNAQTSKNSLNITTSAIEVSEFYKRLFNLNESIKYAIIASEAAFQIQSYQYLSEASELLSSVYELKSDFRNALYYEKEYHKYHHIYENNLHEIEISRLEFEQNLQEESLEVQKRSINNEKELFVNQIYVYMLLFLLLLLVVILIYVYFYFKNKENTKRLELSEQTANIGYWELSLITNEMIWSDHFIKIFNDVNIPNPNLNSFLKLFVEKNREDLKNIFNTIIDKRQSIDLEVFTIYGKRVRLLIRYQQRDRNKVFGVIHDITNQYEYELQVKKSELRFRGIFDVSPFGMAIVDIDGFIRQVNQSFCSFIGLPKNKIMHTLYPKLVYSKSLPELNREIDRLVEGESDHFIIEQRFQDKSNSQNWALMHVLLINNQNEPDYFIVQIVDMNDKHENEIEMEKLLKRVSTKNQELESFIYVTSHDLRSPLVNIQGFSNEIIESFKDLDALANKIENEDLRNKISDLINNDIKESISYIKAGSSKIDQLLAGLLKLSRLGRVKMDMKEIDMRKLFNDIIETFQFQIKDNKAEVIIEDLPNCQGDLTQLNQAFSNLIDNAFKYKSPERHLVIRIYAKNTRNLIQYCIEDNGQGIDENHQKKVFELFHRLNPNDNIPGEGLGLSIIKRIADRHQGNIEVISNKVHGTTFIFSLPN